jgi:hypothetical protein
MLLLMAGCGAKDIEEESGYEIAEDTEVVSGSESASTQATLVPVTFNKV